jgi:TolB-like protein
MTTTRSPLNTRLALGLSIIGLAALTACSTRPDGIYVKPEPTYEQARESKFVASSREAVDKLLNGLDLKQISPMPILVATIVNVNDMRKTAPLGRTLSEQYASQLVNRGLLVKEMKLRGDIFIREETGELMLSREIKEIAKIHSAGLVLVGTYSAAAHTTFISLKLVRTENGQIVSGYDYALPNNSDIKQLLLLK